jgi:hypothetical protein
VPHCVGCQEKLALQIGREWGTHVVSLPNLCDVIYWNFTLADFYLFFAASIKGSYEVNKEDS